MPFIQLERESCSPEQCHPNMQVIGLRLSKLSAEYLHAWGRDNAASIVTRYRLDGPGIESWWRQDFLHLPRPALGPTQPPIQWIPGLSPHLALRLKEE